jgi:hypothetical protein
LSGTRVYKISDTTFISNLRASVTADSSIGAWNNGAGPGPYSMATKFEFVAEMWLGWRLYKVDGYSGKLANSFGSSRISAIDAFMTSLGLGG